MSQRGRGRRTMNEINMVPFIDVMLVLLIIFMVSAPLITTGLVDLPSVGKARTKPQSVIEIVLTSDRLMKLKVDNGEPVALGKAQLIERVRQAQGGNPEVPVVIAADKGIRYESVVEVMALLQKGSIQRVGLAVKQAP